MSYYQCYDHEPACTVVLKLLDIFNNVFLSGCVPEDWNMGDVVLLVKKNPPSMAENYHPISCVSKFLTKILVKLVSLSVESSGVLGTQQQGLRKDRGCEDSIFVLNSLVSKACGRRLVSHLLFLDLKQAYDRLTGISSSTGNSCNSTFPRPL